MCQLVTRTTGWASRNGSSAQAEIGGNNPSRMGLVRLMAASDHWRWGSTEQAVESDEARIHLEAENT